MLRSLSHVSNIPVGMCVTLTPRGIPTRIPVLGGSGQTSNFQSFGFIVPSFAGIPARDLPARYETPEALRESLEAMQRVMDAAKG